MRAGAGLVTALAAGVLLLSACGPTVGGAGAIDTPSTTTAAPSTSSTPAPTTSDAAPSATATSDSSTASPTTSQPAPSPSSAAAPTYLLTAGAKGDQVRELQARLKQLE